MADLILYVVVLVLTFVFVTYAMPQGKPNLLNNSVLNDANNNEDNVMKFDQAVDVDAGRECSKANTTDNDLFPYPLHASCSVEW